MHANGRLAENGRENYELDVGLCGCIHHDVCLTNRDSHTAATYLNVTSPLPCIIINITTKNTDSIPKRDQTRPMVCS